MLIIRILNCIDAASGIVTLSKWPPGAQVERELQGREDSTNSVEDRGQREWGSGGASSLIRGSGGSCKLVQEISFHIVKFS